MHKRPCIYWENREIVDGGPPKGLYANIKVNIIGNGQRTSLWKDGESYELGYVCQWMNSEQQHHKVRLSLEQVDVISFDEKAYEGPHME